MGYTIAPDSLWQLLVSLAIVGTSIVAIWTFYRTIVQPILIFFRHTASIFGKIENIEKEFYPNGGGTLKDSVNRVEKMVARNDGRLRTFLRLDDIAMSESDAGGNIVWVNEALCRLLQRPERHFMNSDWVDNIHPDYREIVHKEWENALSQKRKFVIRFPFVDIVGNSVFVEARGEPFFDEKQEYLGSFCYYRETKNEKG